MTNEDAGRSAGRPEDAADKTDNADRAAPAPQDAAALLGLHGRPARSRRSLLGFLRTFLSLPASRSITARTLVKLFLSSLKLYPVALAAQSIGMAGIAAAFWISGTEGAARTGLLVWCAFGLVELWASLVFVRSFWRDGRRVERVRLWIRRWTMLAASAGVLWGAAGAALMIPQGGMHQVVVVAVVVAVTFASWPVYSCWMPSLTAFTLLSLAPVTISVAAQYGASQMIMASILLVVTGFVLYSGRRLNEILLSSILNDDRNQRLVQRLQVEIERSENARRATERESRRRAQFFAAANHDLRQPLQAMGIFLDILKRRATPQTAPVIEQLTHTSRSIATLVEQVLEVTRMEFGRLELHPESIAIAELLSEIGREFAPVAAEKGLRLRIRPIPGAVVTDRLMLRRALSNLVTNAIRYTEARDSKAERSGRPAEVVVAARRIGGDRVTLGVYDAGPGLTAEDRRRICETFYRGAAGKRAPGTGFGLGLSIVRGICRQLGIAFTIGSRPGRGSVFRLVLSLAESEQVKTLKTLAGDAAERPAAPAERLAGTVLLLEDNPFVREALSARLSGRGLTVVAAERCDEGFIESAKRAAAQGARIALLSDFNLGEGERNGLESAAALERALLRRVPAVLLTAVAADLIESEWRRLASDVRPAELPVILQKPVTEEALSGAISRALGRTVAVSAGGASQEPRQELSEQPEQPERPEPSEGARRG